MNKRSIKDFGGEVKFTKYIAQNSEVANRLLDEIGDDVSDMQIVPEDRVTESKRVDLVIREYDDVRWVIECQDASGWLDPVHASKIVYYCYEKKCFNCVLLTEDATEEMKDYVKFLNSETPLNIWLISPLIYDQFVDFKTIMRPVEHKNILRKSGNDRAAYREQNYASWADEINQMKSDYPDFFTPNNSVYSIVRVLDGRRINVKVIWQVNSCKVCLIRKNRNTDIISDDLRNAFKEKYPNHGEDTGAIYTHLDRYDQKEIYRVAKELDDLLEGEWKNL